MISIQRGLRVGMRDVALQMHATTEVTFGTMFFFVYY